MYAQTKMENDSKDSKRKREEESRLELAVGFVPKEPVKEKAHFVRDLDVVVIRDRLLPHIEAGALSSANKSCDLIAIAICESNRESQITSDLRQCEPFHKSSLF